MGEATYQLVSRISSINSPIEMALCKWYYGKYVSDRFSPEIFCEVLENRTEVFSPSFHK